MKRLRWTNRCSKRYKAGVCLFPWLKRERQGRERESERGDWYYHEWSENRDHQVAAGYTKARLVKFFNPAFSKKLTF